MTHKHNLHENYLFLVFPHFHICIASSFCLSILHIWWRRRPRRSRRRRWQRRKFKKKLNFIFCLQTTFQFCLQSFPYSLVSTNIRAKVECWCDCRVHIHFQLFRRWKSKCQRFTWTHPPKWQKHSNPTYTLLPLLCRLRPNWFHSRKFRKKGICTIQWHEQERRWHVGRRGRQMRHLKCWMIMMTEWSRIRMFHRLFSEWLTQLWNEKAFSQNFIQCSNFSIWWANSIKEKQFQWDSLWKMGKIVGKY